MHRAKEADLRSKLEDERQKTIDESRWVVQSAPTNSSLDKTEERKKPSLIVKYESSISSLLGQRPSGGTESLIFGRRSFNHFNKDIERLERQYAAESNQNASAATEIPIDNRGAEIPDDELFRRHQRYVGIGRTEAQSIVNAIADPASNKVAEGLQVKRMEEMKPAKEPKVSLKEKKLSEKRRRQPQESTGPTKKSKSDSEPLAFRKPT